MNERAQLLVALETARAVTADLNASLPASVDPAMLTLRSKLPFTALSIREVLFHRVSHLAVAAVTLYEAQDYLGGVIITRSIFETVALAFAVERALNRFIRVRNKEALHRYLMQVLLAHGAPDAKYKPMDVTGLVDSLDKKAPGFRDAYNAFSECVHPNWSGTYGTFARIDPESRVLHLGMSEDSSTWGAGIHALTGALIEFQRIYAALPPLITEMNSYFESLTPNPSIEGTASGLRPPAAPHVKR
jgi:hypothetical protein